MKRITKEQVFAPLAPLRRGPASRWFFLATTLLFLFSLYTLLLATGVFTTSTARVEWWLLGRHITRADCVFYEWRNLGGAFFILVVTVLLGISCFRLGYRWPVAFYLLLIFFACLLCESVGKMVLTQPVPHAVSDGMGMLGCPQLHDQPASVHLSAAIGMWWNVPAAPPQLSQQVRVLSQRPGFSEWSDLASSYPGGHAMRSSFVGVPICWLCWRHIKRPVIRVPLMILVLAVSLGIGFIQFYLGAHLITDTIAGYLLGLAAACCTIGILLLNGPRQGENKQQRSP
jgi:membrane-associated phospholipid phosphatase